MITLFAYLLVGAVLLFVLLTEFDYEEEVGILKTVPERFVFIWAWPAFIFVIFLFRFCRDDDEPVNPQL